jgi:hypothetical protein
MYALRSSAGSSNAACGYGALQYSPGSNNCVGGNLAAEYMPGSNNTVWGNHSTRTTYRTVNYLTAIGSLAADAVTTGSSNVIAIGYSAGYTATTTTNQLYLGGWNGSTQYPVHHNWEVPAGDLTAAVGVLSTNKLRVTINRVDYYLLVTNVGP